MTVSESNGSAVVIGASGGIGAALAASLRADRRYARVVELSRTGRPALDLLREDSIAAAAEYIASLDAPPRLILDATGVLHAGGTMPEKALAHLDPVRLSEAFVVNATGPALLMKHFLPLLPRRGRSVFATLSARVGSIADNRAGGWYAYRASKAALNQFVRTAAIELSRRCPNAVCVALHPGTVDTALSAPFAKTDLDVRPPDEAASDLLAVLERLEPADTGGFFDHRGEAIPW